MQLTSFLALVLGAQQVYSAAIEPRSGGNGIKYVKEPSYFTSAFHTRAVIQPSLPTLVLLLPVKLVLLVSSPLK